MDKRERKAERKGKRGRTVLWEDGDSTEDGEWVESNDPPSPFDHGDGHDDVFGDRYVVLPEGTRTQRKVRKRPQPSSHKTTDSGSSSKDTTSPSASPVSDGSGGGKGVGSSGNETAPPSVSPVSDGSGGGEEAGSKTVNGKEPEEQESDTEVEKQLWCRVGKHIKGCTCPCSPHEHTPSCKCFETADGLDKMMQEWGNSQKHWARELIRDGVHLQESDEEP